MQAGYLALLAALAVANGGRETAGLAVYFLISGWIFLRVFREEGRWPDSAIGRPLRVFLLVTLAAALYSFAVRLRGLLQWTALLTYALHFQILLRDRNEAFEDAFLRLVVALGVLFSLAAIPLGFGVFLGTVFPNINLLMSFVDCAALLAAARLIHGPKTAQRGLAVAAYAALAVMAAGEWFAFSRAALFALCAGLAFLMMTGRGRRIAGPALAVLILGLGAILVSGRAAHRMADKVASVGTDTRWSVWRSAGRAFLQKPLQGWGLGGFLDAYRLDRLPVETQVGRYERLTQFAHDEPLQLAVETGILGLAVFLWLVIAGFRAALPAAADGDWKKRGMLACVIALFAQSLFDFNFHLPILDLLLAFFAARLLEPEAGRGIEPGPRARSFVRVLSAAGIAAAAFVLSAAGCAAWARLAERRDRPESARAAWRWAVRLNPFHPDLLDALALRSDPSEAERCLKRAVRLRPEDDLLEEHLARLLQYQKRLPEAEKAYARAAAANPRDPFHYADLADLKASQGETGEAEALYRRAVELEPFYAYGHYRLGEFLRARGQKLAAAAAFRNAMAVAEAPQLENERRRPSSPYLARLLGFDADRARKALAEMGEKP